MEIILKQDVKNLGYADEIVKVKNGYGLNYLIPKGMAVIASEANKKVHTETMKQRAHKMAKIKGDAETARKFIDNLELFSLLANVADVKSLVIHPASTTHAELNEQEQADQGIKPNTIRLSIGTEHIDDIIEDLDEAFKAVAE